jgi:protein-tyrosine phosphatase
MKILMVCLGNICRSPTAEGVMRHLLREQGLDGRVTVDSAGTGGWHIGQPRDHRSVAAAHRRGFSIDGQGRQVTREDFESYDLLLAMDGENLRELRRMAPPGTEGKVRALRDWDPEGAGDVPDPYYGEGDGFDEVLDIVERSCRALVADLT